MTFSYMFFCFLLLWYFESYHDCEVVRIILSVPEKNNVMFRMCAWQHRRMTLVTLLTQFICVKKPPKVSILFCFGFFFFPHKDSIWRDVSSPSPLFSPLPPPPYISQLSKARARWTRFDFLRRTTDDGPRHTQHSVIRKSACKQERLGGGLAHFYRKGFMEAFLDHQLQICPQSWSPTPRLCPFVVIILLQDESTGPRSPAHSF